MSIAKAAVIFLIAAVMAWLAAYMPEMLRRQRVMDALDAPIGRWVCVINGDAVSSQYEGYITKKYIMLGGQRFYSEEFKKWGRAADYMLMVIDDSQFIRWMRLDLSETDDYAKKYGITKAGCRRIEANQKATDLVVPVTPPVVHRVYPGPGYQGAPGYSGSSGNFDWKRAVGPALGGSSGDTGGATGGGGSGPAPSNGGVTP